MYLSRTYIYWLSIFNNIADIYRIVVFFQTGSLLFILHIHVSVHVYRDTHCIQVNTGKKYVCIPMHWNNYIWFITQNSCTFHFKGRCALRCLPTTCKSWVLNSGPPWYPPWCCTTARHTVHAWISRIRALQPATNLSLSNFSGPNL